MAHKKKHHRRKNPGMTIGDYMHEHPWMTFFIVTGATQAVVTMVRGYPIFGVPTPKDTTPTIVVTPPAPALPAPTTPTTPSTPAATAALQALGML